MANPFEISRRLSRERHSTFPTALRQFFQLQAVEEEFSRYENMLPRGGDLQRSKIAQFRRRFLDLVLRGKRSSLPLFRTAPEASGTAGWRQGLPGDRRTLQTSRKTLAFNLETSRVNAAPRQTFVPLSRVPSCAAQNFDSLTVRLSSNGQRLNLLERWLKGKSF